jgi:hypothetical protein
MADDRNYEPGSFGCHEALHMAHVLGEAVAERLCEHPAVQMDSAWAALAGKAREALFQLYQAIGAKHLMADAGKKWPKVKLDLELLAPSEMTGPLIVPFTNW